ncbi:D-alanyl-D-alanine carboxypeptidase family protein [Oscillospiraceae bacterium MB08-C2-2]|nr:D-alanyl-D-alanine carboxypeptidase family protein [Oscillospiraceae bacterium MB08-C2-2]
MIKKSASMLLALLLALMLPVSGFADEVEVDLKINEPLPTAVIVDDKLPAKSAILLHQDTGQVLFEKNADEQLPPASITKVMTLLLVMEAIESKKISLNDMVETSEHANSMGGSQIWLKVGEKMSVDELLKAICISSANDASVALAEHVAGSEDAFVDLMNQRAAELKMDNTHFLNCSGLDEQGHLTTARDIAIMSRELMNHPLITQYSTIWMDELRGGETQLVNTNKLVRFYKGATGLKTGTTNGAGSCLSATATREGLSLVAVVMGSALSDERFASARGLLDYGFANFTTVAPPPVDDQLVPVKVLRGVNGQVSVQYSPPKPILVDKLKKDSITQEVTLVSDVEAPIEKGQTLGKVEVMVDGTVVGEYLLMAGEAVDRMTIPRAFSTLIRTMLQMTPNASAAYLNTSGQTEPGPIIVESGGWLDGSKQIRPAVRTVYPIEAPILEDEEELEALSPEEEDELDVLSPEEEQYLDADQEQEAEDELEVGAETPDEAA